MNNITQQELDILISDKATELFKMRPEFKLAPGSDAHDTAYLECFDEAERLLR